MAIALLVAGDMTTVFGLSPTEAMLIWIITLLLAFIAGLFVGGAKK